jgi:DNA-binding beta-propeller fold protein YncE
VNARAPNLTRLGWSALLAVIAVVALPERAPADILFGTSDQGRLDQINTGTNQVTTILNTAGGVDSLVFDLSGRLIYSLNNLGQVRRFNPTTNFDELLANSSNGLNAPIDLALEPGGNTALVSDFNAGKIFRINLTTKNVTTLGTYGGNPEGITYDNSGRLFANLGNRNGGAAGKFVAQLDPVTGAILAQSPGLNSLDGLTFDPFTGKLFAASLFGNGIYELNPNNLAAAPLFFGGPAGDDGITSNGKGSIFVVSRSDLHVYEFNIGTSSFTQRTFDGGLDDLAPAAGLGAPSAVIPEPTSLSLLGISLLGLIGYRWRRRAIG